MEVAYTEMLKVLTKGRPISFGLLDTMNGHAQLQSNGGTLTVEGLDGSAELESQGGAIQVRSCKMSMFRHREWACSAASQVRSCMTGGVNACILMPTHAQL